MSLIKIIYLLRWLESYNGKRIEIHGFADICMKTYDEYYLYSMHTTGKADGVIKSQLVYYVKSRITPVISITKLELCATLLSSRHHD